MYCKECGQHMSEHERVCSICGARNNAPQQENKNAQYSSYVERYNNHIPPAYNIPNSNPPMKWHKFLVYFYLFWRMLNLLVSAYQYVSEGIETILVRTKYDLAPMSYPYVMAIEGVILFSLVVRYVVVWQALFRRKRYGISLLLFTFLWESGIEVVMVICETCAFPDTFVNEPYYALVYLGYILGLVGGGCILFFSHKSYYEKRAHLFEG